MVGRDISVGIATGYGLDGPRIGSRWEREFPHSSRSTPWPTQPSIKWVLVLSPGSKAVGAWCWPPTPSCAEVKERVDLHPYSPSGPSWPTLGWTLPLPLFHVTWTVSDRESVSYIRLLNARDSEMRCLLFCICWLRNWLQCSAFASTNRTAGL
jgi:hypothetical protein